MAADLSEQAQTRTIETDIPARLDRLPWARFYWLIVLGLGTAWVLDGLRTEERAVGFLQQFFSEGKAVGVICHGPWTLVEADLVRDRTIT